MDVCVTKFLSGRFKHSTASQIHLCPPWGIKISNNLSSTGLSLLQSKAFLPSKNVLIWIHDFEWKEHLQVELGVVIGAPLSRCFHPLNDYHQDAAFATSLQKCFALKFSSHSWWFVSGVLQRRRWQRLGVMRLHLTWLIGKHRFGLAPQDSC